MGKRIFIIFAFVFVGIQLITFYKALAENCPHSQYVGVSFMNKIILQSGTKINSLTILKTLEPYKKASMVLCKCDCGNEKAIMTYKVVDGGVKSCGCLLHKGTPKHGLRQSNEYSVWIGIKTRCYNRKEKKYKDYGGRGIKVCNEWKNSFEQFYNDMGKRPEGKYEIERIDNNGNYCKENCRWATKVEQANNKRSNRVIEYNGQIKNLTQWCKELSLNYGTIHSRLYRDKMTAEKAFTL